MGMARHVVLLMAALAASGCGDIGEAQGSLPGTEADAPLRIDAQVTLADAMPDPVDSPRPDAAPIDAPPPDAEPAPLCEGGDRSLSDPLTGNCYTLFLDERSWDDAQAACEQAGGNLATINSAEENTVVASFSSGLVDLWLGGTDAEEEDNFVWVTGEPLGFEGWRSGEPNDGDDNGEDCMVMEADNDGTWDDRDCQKTFPYICERD